MRVSWSWQVLLVWAFLIGAASALAGGYWDDAWHTERGRDAFFIAPHIAIYAGITLSGSALGLLLARELLARRWESRAPGPLVWIGVIALGGTLASAPIDNAWHIAFGRDAVLWSPPHMLGIVGAMGLAYVLLLHLREHTAPPVFPALAGGLVVAAAAFAVAEYETDVPQFAAVWYPVVLGFSVAVACGLVRAAWSTQWAATSASLVQTVFLLLVGGLLLALDFDAPLVSLTVVCGLAIDLAARRGLGLAASGATVATGIVLIVLPLRQATGDLGLSVAEVAVAIPATWLACTSGLWLAAGGPRRRFPVLSAVTASLAALLAFVGPAGAHDPGQGDPAGTVNWNATVTDRAAVLNATSGVLCSGSSARFVGRRGGQVVSTVWSGGGCSRSARLTFGVSGRWFTYLEVRTPVGVVESWIPLDAGATSRVSVPARYAYRVAAPGSTRAVKAAAGVLVYGGVLVFLLLLARAAQPMTTGVPTATRR